MPEQIRLAFGNNWDEMTVSWATSNVTTPVGYVPIVQWGVAPGLGNSAVGATANYTAFEIKSPFIHRASMTSLKPLTNYAYRVGSDEGGWSVPATFTSAPAQDDKAYPVTFLAYGDMGISNSEATAVLTASLIASGEASFIIHSGDISYADNRAGTNNGSWYDGVLNTFYNEVQNASSLAPYMMSSGNHEAILGFLAYQTRVSPTMPTASSNGSAFWYSWNYGGVHFLAFDSDQAFAAGSPQYNWMVADLAAVDRAVTPWVIAYNHFPLLCSNTFWCPDATALRHTFEPIFNAPATKVDLMLSGHVHAAEIVYPSTTDGTVVWPNFTAIPTTLTLMTGFPGDIEVCCNDWTLPKPAFSYWRADDVSSDGGFFGFSQLTVQNDTHLRIQVWDAVNTTVVKDLWVSRAWPAPTA